jgi:hypothetical protein
MKAKLLFLIIQLFLFANCQSSKNNNSVLFNNFDLLNINKTNTILKKLDIDWKYGRIPHYEGNYLVDTTQYFYETKKGIFDNFKISLINANFNLKGVFGCLDTLKIQDSKFSVHEYISESCIFSTLQDVYFLEKENLLIVVISDSSDKFSYKSYFFLFDIENINKPILLKDENNKVLKNLSIYPNFISDYDNNNKLDIAVVDEEYKKIHLFNIKENKLIKTSNFLKISIDSTRCYYIHNDSSNWFFQLPPNNIDSCGFKYLYN